MGLYLVQLTVLGPSFLICKLWGIVLGSLLFSDSHVDSVAQPCGDSFPSKMQTVGRGPLP